MACLSISVNLLRLIFFYLIPFSFKAKSLKLLVSREESDYAARKATWRRSDGVSIPLSRFSLIVELLGPSRVHAHEFLFWNG
ncbi:hypothetical protein L3X38_040407 [Prunus dulcis]|uniref:Uncharacterized protein n=1 Tax=Prunus dulcis TaxID=3755 RepID=A0AAD4V8X4_PRUDU|nr:hypothetical protein L3X38_040407 [Prunus dulcis]